MSRIVSPTQFNWTGTRANEVFYKLFGRSFVRSRPGSYKDKNSTAQQLQRSRFKSGNELASKVRGIASFIRENPPTHKSYFSALASQCIAAYINSGGVITFTPESVFLGSGSIPPKSCTALTKKTTSSFTISWPTELMSQFEKDTDEVYILIMDAQAVQPIFVKLTATRSTGTADVTVPAEWDSATIFVSSPMFRTAPVTGQPIYTSPFRMRDITGPVNLQ